MTKLCSLLLLLIFFVPGFCYAAPTISDISGTISNGESIVVSGASFETGPTIHKWDNFESGSNGDPIGNGWSYHTVDEGFSAPYYSDDTPRANRSLSIRCPFIYPKASCQFYKTAETSDKASIYTTFYIRIHKVSGATTTNYKYCYITPSATSFAGSMPRFVYHGNAGGYYITSQADNGGESFDCSTTAPEDNKWLRVELYGKESSGGATRDGEVYLYKQDNSTLLMESTGGCTSGGGGHDNTACQTRDADHWVNAHYGLYCGDRTGAQNGDTYYYDYSDVYLANNWARVEIGNNPTFANCTHREIQIPTAWAAGEITFTMNAGTFVADEITYLFVVDADGIASEGEEIIIGGEGATGGGHTISDIGSGAMTFDNVGSGAITITVQ